MRNIKLLLIFLLSITTLASCKSSEDPAVANPKTGVELIAIGSINFGNVTIGEYREASVQINNYGEAITNFDPQMVSPFSITRITAPCNHSVIPKNASCQVVIRFTPSSPGSFSETLTAADKSQVTSGRGLDSSSYIQYSTSSWVLGEVVSGSLRYQEISITNAGDFTIATPTSSAVSGFTRVFNGCGTFISPAKTCLMRYSIVKTAVGPQTDSLIFSSTGSVPFTVTVSSTVIPGAASKPFTMINVPSYVIANGGDVKTISSVPIRDENNNIVVDGTLVSINLDNLDFAGECYRTDQTAGSATFGKSVMTDDANNQACSIPDTSGFPGSWVTSESRRTVNGTISFKIVSTKQRGDSTITLIAGSASAFSRFSSISGNAVGTISASNYINSTEANGISQIDVNFSPLTDELGYVVEDGTPVYAEMQGLGSIVTQEIVTINGQFRIVVKAPITKGSGTLIVKAGINNGAAPCGWSACGSFPFNFVPGLASGTILMASSQEGIFADPSTGLQANPPEIIQSDISFGPVKDQYNNIVAPGSLIDIQLTRAIGVYGTTSGKSSFTVATNALGMGSFTIQATGTRGFIEITSSKDTAAGSTRLWAYNTAVIRPVQSGLPNNPYKVYMSYFNATGVPLPNENWGLIKSWNNLELQDKNYFGDIKKSAPPTEVTSNMPYFPIHCLFSAGSLIYGSNCYDSNFDAQYNTIRITKTTSGNDPAASVYVELQNGARSLSAQHSFNQVGCYKTDSTQGSPTLGQLLFYEGADEEVCNSLTSDDPASPVYANDSRPWFGGQWLTDQYFNLRFPSIGFLPDLQKTLSFGGFYESLLYTGGFNSLVAEKEVRISNRHTWATLYGQGQPFMWTEEMDIDGIYGDYPTRTVAPTITNSNQELYMFGGLSLEGTSDGPQGPVTNYVQSSVTDQFKVFDGPSNKWFSLSPGSDNLIIDEEEQKTPVSRFQHGMVYVPDNDTLFLGAGLAKNLGESVWYEPNDLWSVNNISNRLLDQDWKRRCSPCGFPINSHDYVYYNSNLMPGTLDPSALKMTYHPYLNKVFMLWSKKGTNISSFNPLATTNLLNIQSSNPYSFASLQGTDLYDMVTNAQTGRTYFYTRKTKNAYDSKLHYWDMDAGMKQYVKFEIDLGADSKTFARSLNVHVRGYGKVTDNSSSKVVQGTGGIDVRIYNFVTESWVSVGRNEARDATTDSEANSIDQNFDAAIVKDLISSEGKVLIMAFPRGNIPCAGDECLTNPNGTEYAGEGYNELRIDEIYIGGLF